MPQLRARFTYLCMRNSAPYPIYFERTFELTTNWATYSVDFIPPANDPNGLLVLNLGATTGQTWLDDFALTPDPTSLICPYRSLICLPPGRRSGRRQITSAATPRIRSRESAAVSLDVGGRLPSRHSHPSVRRAVQRHIIGIVRSSDTGETSANTWYAST